MKRILLLLFLLYSGFSFAQWQLVNVPTNPDIFDMSFPSNQTGYVCGYGNRFFRTTNGGSNWLDLSFEGTAHNFDAIWFVNDKTGFLASSNDTIYKTSDGGISWYNKYYVGYPLKNIQFLDSLHGYASAYNKFIYTSNSGESWINIPCSTSGEFFFLNLQTGWSINYLGGGNSELYKTTNGGLIWTLQYSTTDFRILYDVFFVDQNTGWACGYRHFIAKTTNGGVNWVVQNEQASAMGLYSISFINSNTGWTAGDYYSSNSTSCYFTTNGGANWIKESGVAFSGRITKIRFSSQNKGWIGGQFGRVYVTNNSGGLTNISNQATAPLEFQLNQNYPNPFNPNTKISYTIENAKHIKLTVYDIRGNEIETLVNEIQSPGLYEIDFRGSNLSSGIYFYKMQTDNFEQTKKMILIK